MTCAFWIGGRIQRAIQWGKEQGFIFRGRLYCKGNKKCSTGVLVYPEGHTTTTTGL
ncbi:hypothetical protein DPMN_123597 [Dreissena polymorpha]|uniref:Uncharacterized protein n=1 Tax=Dreissena polymorpha TaxID=45954 RepID=A0A9D4GR71_DREPO|nr:hypothetical protein DPMN_123563 [Dreissena polymorpha]KAH3821829.1 hypothetical protein DPMN_123597 [Dreissena polymorpha]